MSFSPNPPAPDVYGHGLSQGQGAFDGSALPGPASERNQIAVASALAMPAIPAAAILAAGAVSWAFYALASDKEGMARVVQDTSRDLGQLAKWTGGQVQLAAGYLQIELQRLFKQAKSNPLALQESVRQLPQQLA